MKNRDLYTIYQGLQSVSNIWWARFSYWVSKNKKLIYDELKSIEESLITNDEYKEFDKKRIELCEKHSKKDEKWEAIKISNNYDIENMEDFMKETGDLREEYKTTIDEQQKNTDDYNKLLDEEIKIELFKIKSEILPEEITANQLDPIISIID